MRSHGRLTRSLIAAALLCAAACSQAPDSQPEQQEPVEQSASQGPPAGGAAGPRNTQPQGDQRPAADERQAAAKPLVVFIKNRQTPQQAAVYSTFAGQIQAVLDRSKRDRNFEVELLDAGSENAPAALANSPYKNDVERFFSTHHNYAATAAVFRPGAPEAVIRPVINEQGRVVDPETYARDINTALAGALGGVAGGAEVEERPGRNGRPADRAIDDLKTSVGKLSTQAGKQDERLEALEKSWVFDPVWSTLVGLLALTLVAALLLGALWLFFLKVKDMREQLDGLAAWKDAKDASERPSQKGPPAAGAAKATVKTTRDVAVPVGLDGRTAEGLQRQLGEQSGMLTDQGRQLGDILGQLSGLDQRLSRIDLQTKQSLSETITWLGRLHAKGAWADGGSGTEAERAALTARVEGYAARLRSLAAQVEPLTTAMASLSQSPGVAASQGLHTRVQKLYEDIHRFEDAERRLEAKLHSLRNGSSDQRRARFEYAEGELRRRSDGMSPPDLIKEYRQLFEQHYPDGPKGGADGAAAAEPVSADDAERLISGAQDHLMDWFSNYTQLLSQTQAAVADAPPAARGVTEEMAGVLAVAREVLRGFDILPVEIQLGQTAYDHRLYDTAMIKATAEYPPNTVIQVQRAGFRRISNGEVLRRPQVIISGASTAV